eukprot:2645669-Rhodomonas_salina.3
MFLLSLTQLLHRWAGLPRTLHRTSEAGKAWATATKAGASMASARSVAPRTRLEYADAARCLDALCQAISEIVTHDLSRETMVRQEWLGLIKACC